MKRLCRHIISQQKAAPQMKLEISIELTILRKKVDEI